MIRRRASGVSRAVKLHLLHGGRGVVRQMVAMRNLTVISLHSRVERTAR